MPVFDQKILAQGQLPNAKGTLYTCPADTSVAVTGIVLCNADGSAHTVNIYAKKSGGSSRRIYDKDKSLASKESATILHDSQAVRLGDGDLIEGDADTATQVDYTLFGVTKVS